MEDERAGTYQAPTQQYRARTFLRTQEGRSMWSLLWRPRTSAFCNKLDQSDLATERLRGEA